MAEQVVLPDGTAAWVWPLLPTDRRALVAEFEQLSPESVRSRFLGPVVHLSEAMLQTLVDDVDGIDHVALVLLAEVGDDVLPVAIGRIVRYPDQPDAADLAITVKDAWQGRGVASALVPLQVAKRPAGVTRLVTEVAVGKALDRDGLEDVAQGVPRRDPDVLEHLGGLVVGDRLGAQAVDADQRAVDGADDVGDTHVTRAGGQPPAAGLAALADHDAGPTHVREDRLQEAVRDLLQPAELLGAHRPTVVTIGDLDEGPEGIVGLGGDAHAVSLSDRSY